MTTKEYSVPITIYLNITTPESEMPSDWAIRHELEALILKHCRIKTIGNRAWVEVNVQSRPGYLSSDFIVGEIEEV